MEILVKQTIESLREDLGYEEWEDVDTYALLTRQGYEGYVIEVEDGETFEIPEETVGQIIDEDIYYMNIEIFENVFEKEIVEGDLEAGSYQLEGNIITKKNSYF